MNKALILFLALLVGSAHAEDTVNELTHIVNFNTYKHFQHRIRVAEALSACDRKGIAQSLRPTGTEIGLYALVELDNIAKGDDEKGVLASGLSHNERGRLAHGAGIAMQWYALGVFDATRRFFDTYTENVTEGVCEAVVTQSDEMLQEQDAE